MSPCQQLPRLRWKWVSYRRRREGCQAALSLFLPLPLPLEELPCPEQGKHKRATPIPGEGWGRGDTEKPQICPKLFSRQEVELHGDTGLLACGKRVSSFAEDGQRHVQKLASLWKHQHSPATPSPALATHPPPQRAPRPNLPPASETRRPEQARVISRGFARFWTKIDLWAPPVPPTARAGSRLRLVCHGGTCRRAIFCMSDATGSGPKQGGLRCDSPWLLSRGH